MALSTALSTRSQALSSRPPPRRFSTPSQRLDKETCAPQSLVLARDGLPPATMREDHHRIRTGIIIEVLLQRQGNLRTPEPRIGTTHPVCIIRFPTPSKRDGQWHPDNSVGVQHHSTAQTNVVLSVVTEPKPTWATSESRGLIHIPKRSTNNKFHSHALLR